MFSTIYANRPVQDGPHVAPQHDPNKVGKEGRLQSTEHHRVSFGQSR